MTRLIIFTVISAVIEMLLLLKNKDSYGMEKEDPMVVHYKAHKVNEPGLNYIPGMSTYDEKSKRYVSEWKYEWVYRGKKHSMMFHDNPNYQYGHYLTVFHDEIDITIHKETGKYYISKTVRAKKRQNLRTLLISMLVGWVISGVLVR